jgi:hypothetical protein
LGKQLKQSDVFISTGKLTVDQLKIDRDIAVQREASSHQQWEKLAEEDRLAIRDIVIHMFETVLDQVDSWLPGAVDMNDVGQFVDVRVRTIFADLKTQVESRREMTSRQFKLASEETLAMAKGE